MAQEQVRNVKVVGLDFDNNIALDPISRRGSEDIKDQVWLTIFSDMGRCDLEDVLAASQKAVSGGKGDRYDIIRNVLMNYNYPNNLIADEVNRRANLFDEIVQDEIIRVGVSTANRKALDDLSRVVPLYINTGTPVEKVIESMETLGLMKYFKGIYGRPDNKLDNLKKIIEREGVSPDQVLFVGDADADWEAALMVQCQFLGMRTARNTKWNENKMPFPIIYSLADIKLRKV